VNLAVAGFGVWFFLRVRRAELWGAPFQNGTSGLLRANWESISIEFRAAMDSAACYGVNLAVAGFGVWFLLPGF
jgi:hypothetical protein